MLERQRRLVALTQRLVGWPRQWLHLGELADRWGVSKSTLSADLALVREALEAVGGGRIETQVGALGGVMYVPGLDQGRCRLAMEAWLRELGAADRLTPDGFLYMSDLVFDPRLVDPMGELLAWRFADRPVDLVATVETKGIPLATAAARSLGVAVVLLRRDNRLSEGSALSINYLSGSSRRIQSMSLARRTPVRGKRVLFIDDFLKAGGTARAAADLLNEFDAEVCGVGVLMATADPVHKLIPEFSACLEWEWLPGRTAGQIRPSAWARAAVFPERAEEGAPPTASPASPPRAGG